MDDLGTEEDEVKIKLQENGEEKGNLNARKISVENVKAYGFGWRHVVTLLAFFGFFVNYILRVNLSVGLVAMVNHTALHESKKMNSDYLKNGSTSYSGSIKNQICQQDVVNGSASAKKDGPFIWDESVQGIILASFFYGYIITQIPGGLLAGKFGAKWVFGIGTVWTAALTLLTPLAAELGAGYLIGLRILMGLGEGITWPAIQALYAHWAPPSERSQLPSFAASGCLFGTLVAFIFSGLLAGSDFLGGWPAVFYVFGFLGCVWFIFWAIFVESTPEKHRWISKDEKHFIVEALNAEGRKRPDFKDIQWMEIAKSLPVWAAIISHFTYNWSLYVLLTGLPLFFKDVLGFDIKANGVAAAIPYLFQGIIQALAGKLADLMRSKFGLSTGTVRKILDCSGHFLPAIFLISVGYVGCDHRLAVALLVLAVSTSGLCGGGFFFNWLDLAPQFSSILYGISNTFATIPGIIGPSVTGALIKGTQGDEMVAAWRCVFFIAAGLYFFSVIFYFIFAKGDIQPWAKEKRAITYEYTSEERQV